MHLSFLFLAFLSQAQAVDPTLPPSSAHVMFTAKGSGTQIYKCLAQESGFAWVFQSPEAVLLDPRTNQPLGTHAAGPTWTWKDGSAITGTVVQKQASPEPASIPWLLLKTQATGTTTGALSNVSYVRRSETQAGSAPATGCDARAAQEATTIHVPYVATYTFYSTDAK
jgi:hypothetical protein